MTKIITITFFFILPISILAQGNDEELLRKNYESYNTFLHEMNGEAVVHLVNSRTINYFEEILELVKNADSLKVESLSLFDKIMVLAVRHTVPKEDILEFDGKSLLVYGINNGTIDLNNSTELAIGTVTIDNNFAKGQIVADGIESPYFAHFNKEDEQWKYDLTSSFSITNTTLKKLVKETGGEKELIRAMLSQNSEARQSQDIWNPVE